jgi:hypothetical protein
MANQPRQLSSTVQTVSRPLVTAGRLSKIFLPGLSHRQARIQLSGTVTATGEAEQASELHPLLSGHLCCDLKWFCRIVIVTGETGNGLCV